MESVDHVLPAHSRERKIDRAEEGIPAFQRKLASESLEIRRGRLETLQVNVGKLCNQACRHCHVEAGPTKKSENMNGRTVDRLLELLAKSPSVRSVDLTGGAPELNPHFCRFVEEASALGKSVIDRCNLTVLFEKGQEGLLKFFEKHQVEIVASLPCYSRENVDRQRGKGVFGKSIQALKELNAIGYGKPGTGLVLNLVYNPLGAFLPPPQQKLEMDYKKTLREDFEIEFNHLYTITNMPIKRFLDDLKRKNQLEDYMQLLFNQFNPRAVENVMCTHQISIGWDGKLYDCDFNQMLEIPLRGRKKTIWDIQCLEDLEEEEVALANHCYGCTAGAGSSCGGTLI